MSISIYSFVNDKNILDKELKEYYDIIQLNEDKLKGKLTNTELRKVRKLLSKEESSDNEIVKEQLEKLRDLKKLVFKLDEKIERSLSYQESIITKYSINFVNDLEKMILHERIEYEQYIRTYFPVDITKFERFDKEYYALFHAKLPFLGFLKSNTLTRIEAYNNTYNYLLRELGDLECKYKTILRNCAYYDKYLFTYKESDYFNYNKEQFGRIGEDYYKQNTLIPQEEFEKNKFTLKMELAEKGKEKESAWDYFLENNYSFARLQYPFSEKKKIDIKNVSRWDKWYLLLDKDKLILYSSKAFVKIAITELLIYELNESCKGPVIVEILDMQKLINMMVEKYEIYISFRTAVGVKRTEEALLKKKVDLRPLDLEQKYDFEKIEVSEKEGIPINNEVLEELEKQEKNQTYYLTIEKGVFEIIKNFEKKMIKIELEDKEEEMGTAKVFLDRSKIKYDKKGTYYIIKTNNVLAITDKRHYQLYDIMKEELGEEE